MKSMRKLITVLLISILILSTVPVVVVLAEDSDLTIEIESKPAGPVQQNQNFLVEVKLTNTSGTELDEVYLMIDSSSFKSEIGNKIAINDTKKLGPDKSVVVQIPFKYDGGSSSFIPIYVSYKKGETTDNTQRRYIDINTAMPIETPNPTINPSEYIPTLQVDNTKMPVATAGKAFNLKLTINNTSAYGAKDVTITPVYSGEGNDPFQYTTIKQSAFIERINARKSEEVVFNYTIAPNTPAGIYELSLNYSYYNSFSSSEEYKYSETIRVKIENNNAAPSLSVRNITYPENGLQAGTTVPVKLSLMNSGSLAAKDVVVTISGLETGGFTIEGNGNRAAVPSIYRGLEQQVTFNIRVAGTMAAGSHPLTALIEYKDDAGNTYSQEAQFFLPVTTGDPLTAGLEIQNVSVSNKTYGIDENIPVRFTLANKGGSKLYNVKVSLTSDPVIIPKTTPMKVFNVMEAGRSEALEFVFSAKKEAETRNYPIGIEIEYKTSPDGEPINLLQYVGVYVENKDSDGGEGSKSVPKIIIDSYSTDPVIVRAGSNFNLKISFHNTNSEKRVSNIKVSFTAPSETESGSVFTPVNSSNTFYIDSIAPKDSIEMERVYYTIPDAQPKTYTIVANFEYEYEGLDGAPVTAQEQIGIPVVQQTRLETSMITMPPTSYMGQPIPLSFEFYNMGKVTLSNLMITVEGDFTSQTSNYFVGNFEPGYSDYFDTMLYPESTGQLTGAIVFSYDDAAGEPQEIRKEFSTTVEEMPVEAYNPEFPGDFPGDMPPDMMPGEQPAGFMRMVKSPITWIIIVVLGAATVIVIRKIKKRKELSQDE